MIIHTSKQLPFKEEKENRETRQKAAEDKSDFVFRLEVYVWLDNGKGKTNFFALP